MFPRVTHPSAADVLLRPLDLHVLSLPPAFALSQDQTLKLDLNFEPADHNVLTRSHHFSSTEVDELPAIHIAGNDGVTLKRVPPKSFVRSRSKKPKLFKCETRKDSAVHVSLSSSSLVKQPGTRRPQPSREEGFRHPYRRWMNSNRLTSTVVSLNKVRSISGAFARLGQ
jgi:hypothetical protein